MRRPLGDFEITSFLFESDVLNMVNGNGYYRGCERFVLDFLDVLRSKYVPKLNYRLGLIDDARLPAHLRYELQSLESLVVVGNTLSLRRDRNTLRFTAIVQGLELHRDVATMRNLERFAGDISTRRTVKRLETILRGAERQLARWERDEKPPRIGGSAAVDRPWE